MAWHVGRLAGVAVSVLLVMGASQCEEPPKFKEFPGKSKEQSAQNTGPRPMGHIAWQLPFAPLTITLNTDYRLGINASTSIATPLGSFRVSGGVTTPLVSTPALPEAGGQDLTQLLLCRTAAPGAETDCEVVEVRTGRKVSVKTDGPAEMVIDRRVWERDRIIIKAEPGAAITLTDAGGPEIKTVRAAARIDIERFKLHETSQEGGEVDLEASRAGYLTDFSYDHVDGQLQPIHGAKVSQLKNYGSRTDVKSLPGEKECLDTPPDQWRDRLDLTPKLLGKKVLVMCVKTAEGDIGYLYVKPDKDKKPVAFELNSYVWVR